VTTTRRGTDWFEDDAFDGETYTGLFLLRINDVGN